MNEIRTVGIFVILSLPLFVPIQVVSVLFLSSLLLSSWFIDLCYENAHSYFRSSRVFW